MDHWLLGELSLFAGAGDVLEPAALVHVGLHGGVGLARFDEGLVQLDVAWRFVGVIDGPTLFRPLNPYLGVRAGIERSDPDERFRARGGLGLTLPLTSAYRDDFEWTVLSGMAFPPLGGSFLIFVAPGALGMFDLWLSQPETVGVVGRGDVEYRHRYVVAGGDVAVAFLGDVPASRYSFSLGELLVAQLGGFLGGRPVQELVLGVRAQVSVRHMTSVDRGEGFGSILPFVRVELPPAFVECRLLLNLNDPFGFSFTDAMGPLPHLWSVQVLGGATL